MGAYELRDVTAPKTTFSAGPSGPTNDNTPVFQFKANDDGATYECQVDSGGWQTCGSPATTTPLPDGPHTFSVRATDAVFNVEAPPVTRSFTVDTVAPNATITKKPPKRFFKQRVKFKFATDEPGATFQCMLDNLPWRSCSSPYRFNVKLASTGCWSARSMRPATWTRRPRGTSTSGSRGGADQTSTSAILRTISVSRSGDVAMLRRTWPVNPGQ